MSKVYSDNDKGFKALFGRLKDQKPINLTVGIHESEGSGQAGASAATVEEVATWNEFGTARIPERSFLRAWADENEAKNLDTLRKIGNYVLSGKGLNYRQGLAQAGLRFVGEIQQRIRAGIAPPNAASTVHHKGSSKPLIDTGQLVSSIRHKVEEA